MADKSKYLMYKGKPLVRMNDTIYYGDFKDEYVIMLDIKEYAKKGEIEVPSKISIQLEKTDLTLKNKDRIVKKAEKNSLYEAIDISSVWLERALAKK